MKKSSEFIIRQIADEYILVPTGTTSEHFNGMISMTETAVFIYEHIDKVDSFDELLTLFLKEFDIDEQTAYNDIVEFINHLLVNHMIEISDIEKNW